MRRIAPLKVAASALVVVLIVCTNPFVIQGMQRPHISSQLMNQANARSLNGGPVFSDWTLPEEVQFYLYVDFHVYVCVSDPDGIDRVFLRHFSPLNNSWFVPDMYYLYTDEQGRSVYEGPTHIYTLENGTPLVYVFCFEGNDTRGNWATSENITVPIRHGITEAPMFLSWDVPRGDIGHLTVTGPFHEQVKVQLFDPDGIDCVNVSVLSPWTHNWTCYQMDCDPDETEEENWFLTYVDIVVNWTGSQAYYVYHFGANDTLGNDALSRKIVSGVGMSFIDTIAATDGYLAAAVLGGSALCALLVALVCLLTKKRL